MFLTSAADLIDHSVVSLPDDSTSSDVLGLSETSFSVIALIRSDAHLEGLLDYPLREALDPEQRLRPHVSKIEHSFYPDKPSSEIVKYMLKHHLERVAVATRDSFVGLITRKSVLSAYGELVAS